MKLSKNKKKNTLAPIEIRPVQELVAKICAKDYPKVRRTLLKVKGLAIEQVQFFGERQKYVIKMGRHGFLLTPRNALIVACALLQDLARRPWHPDGAEAGALLGILKTRKRS